MVFVSVIAVISSLMFAYSMSSMSEIIREIGRERKQFEEKMADLEEFMEERNLDLQVRSRVRRYLEYLSKEERGRNSEQALKLLSELNTNLQTEV